MSLYRKTLLTAFTLLALAGCETHSGQTVQEPWKLDSSYQEERRYRKLLSLNEVTVEPAGVEQVSR
jgi:hypothetical protein